MQEFKLIVIREKRIYLSFLMLPLLVTSSLFILASLNVNFIIFLVILFSIISGLAYYCYGKLIITVSDKNLNFNWTNKNFFNYEPIQKIDLDSIEKISLTDDTINEIVLKSGKIKIGNISSKSILKNDSEAFISFLKNENIKLEKNDIWDNAKKKGYLIYVYWTLNIVIILSVIGLTTAIILDKFPPSMFIMLGSLGGVLSTQQIIKKKLKNNG